MRTKKRYYQYMRSQCLSDGRYYNVSVSEKRYRVIRYYKFGNNNVRRIRFIHDIVTNTTEYCQHFCGSKCGTSYARHRAGLNNYSTHMYCITR